MIISLSANTKYTIIMKVLIGLEMDLFYNLRYFNDISEKKHSMNEVGMVPGDFISKSVHPHYI